MKKHKYYIYRSKPSGLYLVKSYIAQYPNEVLRHLAENGYEGTYYWATENSWNHYRKTGNGSRVYKSVLAK